MKGFRRGFIAGAIALFAFAIIFSVSQTYASQNDENAAKEVVSKFLDYAKKGDYNKVKEYSMDKHPGINDSIQRKMIEEQKDILKEYTILSAEKVNDQKVIVRLKIALNNEALSTVDYFIVDYPVIRSGSNWIVDVTNAKQLN